MPSGISNVPVHRGESARRSPLKAFGRVAEFYSDALDADRAYNAVLAHNPMPDAHGPGFVTNWMRREPYQIAELAEVIPFGWQIPTVRATAIGRNVGLFETLMRWAGQPVNEGFEVLPAALAVNAGLSDPLPEREVVGIARSVERYRAMWRARGQFDTRGDRQRSLWGRKRGIASGAARRAGTPLEDDRQPWERYGVSRATYYRRIRWE